MKKRNCRVLSGIMCLGIMLCFCQPVKAAEGSARVICTHQAVYLTTNDIEYRYYDSTGHRMWCEEVVKCVQCGFIVERGKQFWGRIIESHQYGKDGLCKVCKHE